MQVQEWINRELGRGYQLSTVKGWYRVLRTMTQDAIVDLSRDPCRRVRFPRPKNAKGPTLFCLTNWGASSGRRKRASLNTSD
jgi:hypothetical protein